MAMARIILITGGSRSGKSSYAQKMAEDLAGPRAFIATCPAIDDEMDERIRKHREARSGALWHTIEETLDLAGAMLRAPEYQVFLIDCLALWVNNLMYEAHKTGQRIDEEDITGKCREVLAACEQVQGAIILVTNEVGMGIVPDNADARLFRDLLGRCNQTIASGAHEVILMACGLPLNLK